jgi:hypothetical protein
MHLDLLAIDTFSFTPHLETTGEICVNAAMAGKRVGFAFLPVDNPDDLPARHVLESILGDRRRRKVAAMGRLLSAQGVHVIDTPPLTPSAEADARKFAHARYRTLQDIRELQYKRATLGLGVASSLISRARDPYPDLQGASAFISRALLASARTFEHAQSLIREHRPSTVVVFNGRFACARPVAEAAGVLGIPRLFHERGGSAGRYVVDDRPTHDYAATRRRIAEAWEEAGPDRDEVARSFFALRRGGDGTGWLSYIDGQEKGRAPPRTTKKRLVYFSTSEDEFVASDDLVRHALFGSQREAMRFLVGYVSRHDDVELVVRVHPHLREKSSRERSWWDGLQGPNVVVETSFSTTDSYALAESADTVLTYASSIGVEAAYLGKPVILLGESEYRALDCAYVPESIAELEELLSRKNLEAKPPERCLPFGYYFIMRGQSYRHYESTSLFHGKFMGVDLSREGSFFPALKGTAAYQRLKSLRAQWAR